MPNTLIQVLTLGIVCGMRAALGPALVSHRLSRRRRPKLGRLEFMRSPTAATIFKVVAIGELIGDKLPLAPARVEPGALSGRIASGALCGATLGRSRRENGAAGAIVGAVGAALGSYVFYSLRRTLTEGGGLPDTAVALAEDALALTLGVTALTDH